MSHLHDRVEHQVGVRLSEPRSYRRVSVTAMAPTSMAIPCLFYLTVQILHKLGLHQFRLRGAKVSIPRGAASATPRPTAPPAAGPPSFNPLLHGAASATCTACQPALMSTSVSIPYFTGRPLQLPTGASWASRGRRGFNPLLHGAASATAILNSASPPWQAPKSPLSSFRRRARIRRGVVNPPSPEAISRLTTSSA